MKRTKEFKETVCSTCRSANGKIAPAGSACKAKNAQIKKGTCIEYRK